MAEPIDAQQLREAKRQEFLFKMYDQMFADIDRHILVVWQSVGLLLGGAAIFALVEKQIITLDIACAIFVVLAGWSVSHSIEAGYWYNRNLVIIANIERQFLRSTDLKEIHHYFGKHRPKNTLLKQLWLQIILSILITAIFLAFHFLTRVKPGFSAPIAAFDFERTFPYIALVVVVALLIWQKSLRNKDYVEFLQGSPGLSVGSLGGQNETGAGR